jgi:hypothetical protein
MITHINCIFPSNLLLIISTRAINGNKIKKVVTIRIKINSVVPIIPRSIIVKIVRIEDIITYNPDECKNLNSNLLLKNVLNLANSNSRLVD